MRTTLALGLTLLAAGSAWGDRLITIPIARKVPFRAFKIDGFAELSRARSWDRWLGIGISPEMELDYHGERISDGPMRDTFDFSYNYVTPIPNQAPGISFGIQDILNRTRDHRNIYVAVTFRQAVDTIGRGNLPFDVTLGIRQGDRTLPMVGVSMPFSDNLRVLVEDNGVRIASGIEWRTLDNAFAARLIVRDQDVMVGANLTLRF